MLIATSAVPGAEEASIMAGIWTTPIPTRSTCSRRARLRVVGSNCYVSIAPECFKEVLLPPLRQVATVLRGRPCSKCQARRISLDCTSLFTDPCVGRWTICDQTRRTKTPCAAVQLHCTCVEKDEHGLRIREMRPLRKTNCRKYF